MNNKNSIKANLGGPSIILIILVLALSIFALLGLRSSSNEKKLAVKTAESIADYYKMNARAEEILAQAEDILATCGEDTAAEQLSGIPEVSNVTADGTNGGISKVEYFVVSESNDRTGLDVCLTFNGNDLVPSKWKVVVKEPEEGYEIILLD